MLPQDAGKNWQTNGNGGGMRRRFQVGHVLKRGKRVKVWVGCYREWVLDGGQPSQIQRRRVLGLRVDMTKGQAEQALREILRPINGGEHAPEQTMTFGQFAAKWETEILTHYRESTKVFYKSTLDRWIIPHFKEWKLAEVKTPDVQTFLNKFAGYSKSVLKHVRATFSIVMATAVDWQYLARNPVEGVKLPAGKAVMRAAVLSLDQLALVIANLGEPYRTMAVIASATAMRESEVLALKWEDFDAEAQIMRVRRSLYRGKLNAPKTEGSERAIPYGELVRQALERLANSKRKAPDFLFVTMHGNLFSAQQVTKRVFRPLAKTLKIPAFSWRSFRRSAETALHTGGVPLKVQQQILGHSNPSMTLLYADPDIAERRKAMSQLDALLLPNVAKLQKQLQEVRPN
jgi:integrase